MGLLTMYPRKKTSQPGIGHKIYPYVLRNLTITQPNQVWGVDIFYILMAKKFVYLVAIMNWASHRVLIWQFSTSLDSQFCGSAGGGLNLVWSPPQIFNTKESLSKPITPPREAETQFERYYHFYNTEPSP